MPVTAPGPPRVDPTTYEVFWGDHRWQNRYARFNNGLVRYTIDRYNPTHPLVEVWIAGTGWTNIGGYQIQSWNGAVYTPLPQQSFSVRTISPEEVVWEEQRYDSASTTLVRLVNRIRRGSRIIESQIICYAGQPCNGGQSVGLINAGAAAVVLSSDATGVVATGPAGLPGFCYLTLNSFSPTISAGALYSGLTVATGAQAFIGVLAGVQDAQYTSLGTAALYAGHWAAVNRMRVKQRLMLGQ